MNIHTWKLRCNCIEHWNSLPFEWPIRGADHSRLGCCSSVWILRNVLTRHENLVLVVLVRVSKDISALKRLWEESKDVVDDQQCGLCVLRASGVCLHAIDGDPLALLLVALADNRGDGAASLGLCRHVCEPSCAVL